MCNAIDRSYLSDSLPNPYTEDAADWWLNTVNETEGKTAVFREIIVHGEIVGSVSIEQKRGVFRTDS